MATEVRLAVAGSGKTQEIASRIEIQDSGVRSLALTFTVNGQNEIHSRISSNNSFSHETMGWFTFLLKHVVRPYLPAVFPNIITRGLCFVDSDSQIPKGRSGWRYYINDEHQPYSTRLGILAKKVLRAAKEAPIRRLEEIYDQIYIDEFQDLVGNDLVILEALMESSISVFITGDVRQSVLQTSRSDRLNHEYRGVNLVDWVRKKEKQQKCAVTYSNETSRFNQIIADFSDQIHDPKLTLPNTISTQTRETLHDGVFLLDSNSIQAYVDRWNPTILWSRSSQRTLPEAELMTFGASKGLTRDRILIIGTGSIKKWLKSKDLLLPKSASGFYVATTRARFSVAIAIDKATATYDKLHPDFSNSVTFWRNEH
ncbi:UvrD-helicase domain-containing protein [Rhodococcus sp. P-2]|uniref:UvrD-helicase domain-containing protein n=1 Tax=Rhodococcus sp. P-2 TaxID=2795031 RepID=UPI0019063351|nr:UvrD-helicase domain-containing protein [Rhodococcus sp. P-2]QQM20554.1 UvrD-helicase domain-containing protein [Rhodococcus sp. P-2]